LIILNNLIQIDINVVDVLSLLVFSIIERKIRLIHLMLVFRCVFTGKWRKILIRRRISQINFRSKRWNFLI